MTEVKFDAKFPDSARPVIDEYLNEFLPLIPRHIHELYVRYVDASNNEAEISVADQYRTAYLDIYSVLLRKTPDEIRHTVLHELCHLFNVPLKWEARKALEICLDEDGAAYKLADFHLTRTMEAATCDLADSILRLLNSGHLPSARES